MLCWICRERIANSGEHKFKSSQLKQMHGKIFEKEIIYGSGSKELRLEGPNNKKVKFPKVICEQCNNSKTSSHDIAFDKLIDWSYKNFDKIQSTQTLDFMEIYGENWLEEKMNLLKYMAKHAGCKIVTGEIENDVTKLSDLIYRDQLTNSFQIKFLVKEAFNHLHFVIKHQGGEGLRFMSNSETIYYKTGNNETVYFAGMTTYNWISVIWIHTQNNYHTRFDGFENQKEDLIFMPFEDLPEIEKNRNWFEFVDKQGMETLSDQIAFYNLLVKV
jgi:hypothetical protein